MQASTKAPGAPLADGLPHPATTLSDITRCLEDHKAEDIVVIDLQGKSSIADHLVIASGRSQRQVSALADYVLEQLKSAGFKGMSVQGQEQADWILIDAGDLIIHLFRPEVRSFYNLDKMWGTDIDVLQQTEKAKAPAH